MSRGVRHYVVTPGWEEKESNGLYSVKRRGVDEKGVRVWKFPTIQTKVVRCLLDNLSDV